MPPPKIGEDVSAMMPAIGEDVSHLMGAVASPAAAPVSSTTPRQDTNIVGFDQDKWTNIASRLPEKVLGVPVRYPATFLGSLAGTALENLSAPENVATMGAAGMAGRVPALVRPGPLPTVAIRTGTVKALGAAADVVSPDIVGVISPRGAHVLRVVQKLRDAMVKEPNTKAASTSSGAGPPRLVGKAPTLTDSLSSIMDELRTEKGTEANVAPSVPGAAPGGEAASRATMRQLAEQSSVASRASLKPPAEISYQRPTFSDADVLADINAREPSVETPKTTAARAALKNLQPVPLGKAMAAVREAAPVARVKLSAVQTKAAMDLVRQGHPVNDVLDAVKVLQQLKESPSMATLPSDAEMAADLSQRGPLGGRTGQSPPPARPGKSPQQLLNEEAQARYRARQAVAAGNPFR